MEQKKLRILVVDDYADTRQALVWFLETLGHRADSAPDIGTALDRLTLSVFDVLLMDVRMHRTSDWDFLRVLRERGQLPSRVISMSTSHFGATHESSKAAGCRAHLVKPF